MNQDPHPTTAEIIALLEGELCDPERASILRHTGECGRCRPAVEELRRVTAALASDVSSVGSLDVLPRVKAALAADPPARWWRRWLWLLPAPVAAVAAALLFLQPAQVEEEAAFRAKGAAASPGAWVGLQAYRRVGSDGAAPVGGSIRAADALLFAYTNGGPEPFAYLMVLAIDAAGRIHWFYPAYTTQGADPSAIRIAPTPEPLELPDAVRHPLAPGGASIHALFLRRPLTVAAVEALVESGADLRAIDDAAVETLAVEVAP